jgi:DnaJ-class molecular chaperone
MAELAPLEVRALVRIIDELTYYQILDVEPRCSKQELKASYYAISRVYHPDANRQLDAELRESCHRISKRITEAYCVLRDPRNRMAYDAKIGDGAGVRMQISEARAAHAKQHADERSGKTPQGKQFLKKAEEDMRREDYASAVNNLQMALTFERDNGYFKELLEQARKKKS